MNDKPKTDWLSTLGIAAMITAGAALISLYCVVEWKIANSPAQKLRDEIYLQKLRNELAIEKGKAPCQK